MTDVSLTPPDRGAIWSSLALTQTQLAELCGLTVRQVGHWTSRGYITTSRRHPERYNGNSIDLCLLIKQGLRRGLPLRRAVRTAHDYVGNELARQPDLKAIEPPVLLDLRETLRNIESSASTLLRAVEPLVPNYPELEPLGVDGADDDGATGRA